MLIIEGMVIDMNETQVRTLEQVCLTVHLPTTTLVRAVVRGEDQWYAVQREVKLALAPARVTQFIRWLLAILRRLLSRWRDWPSANRRRYELRMLL